MRWKRYAMIAGWGVVLGVFVFGMYIDVINGRAAAADFSIYLNTANALRHNAHAAIYSLATPPTTYATYGGCVRHPSIWGYLYQPLLAIVLEPLTFLPCGAATAIWQTMNVGIMVACVAWFAWRMGRRHGAGAALATAAFCILCAPLYEGLYLGQVHLIILGDCLAAVSLMRRNHPRWAGAVLAVGAFLKYLPALLFIYYLARRRWAAAVGAGLTAAMLGLLELVIVGVDTLRASVSGGSGNLAATMYQSMTATLPHEPYIVSFLVLGVFALGCVALARWGGADSPTALGPSVGEVWAIGAMAFASPAAWYDYFTWLLPIVVVLLDIALTMPAGRARQWRLTGIAILSVLAFISAPSELSIPGVFAFISVPSLAAVFAALTLWLICTGVLLTRIGVPLPFARRIPERIAVPHASR